MIKAREKRCVAVFEDVECIPDGAVDETNLLDFPKDTSGETYRDVHISEELIPEQRNQIKYLEIT